MRFEVQASGRLHGLHATERGALRELERAARRDPSAIVIDHRELREFSLQQFRDLVAAQKRALLGLGVA